MQFSSVQLLRRVLFVGLLFVLVAPITAQTFRAEMTVTPVWRPGETLDSVDANANGTFDNGTDDFRYVDVELHLTGNVQFWAATLSCSLGRGELVSYTQNASGDDPGDDVPVVTWSKDWGLDESPAEAVVVSEGPNGFDFDSGTITLTITRLGNVPSLGQNGAEYSMLLATVRLRVADLDRNSTIRPSCRTLEFFDRDGNTVARGRAGRADSLEVYTGYTLSGSVFLQGARSSANIQVNCDHVDVAIAPLPEILTDSRGGFEFGGRTSELRELGEYNCTFEGPAGVDSFLSSETSFNLNTPQYTLLPTILSGGNINQGAGSENDIDNDDLNQMTSNWDPDERVDAFTGLDVNGDGTQDDSDLAILAGNFDSGDQPFDAAHLVVGLATETGDFRFSAPYWTNIAGGSVQTFGRPARDQDFFPQLSPDGSTLVVSRKGSRDGNYSLYTITTDRGSARALTPTRNFEWQTFAPSWSPDGQRVAFICSVNSINGGFLFNEGSLCVIDASGNNFRVLASNARIYPPAWYNNSVIVFGGTSDNTVCLDTLCYFDFNENKIVKVSNNLDFGSSIKVDMPTISHWDHDNNDATDRIKLLIYRHTDGNTKTLRRDTPIYNNDGNAFTMDTFGAGDHQALNASTAVSFYSASWEGDIVFYEFELLSGNYETNGDIKLADAGNWNTTRTISIDGYFGTPALEANPSGEPAGTFWDGSNNTSTLFHINRATLQWVP